MCEIRSVTSFPVYLYSLSQRLARRASRQAEQTLQLPDIHEVFFRGEFIDHGEDGGWVVPQTVEFLGREGEDVLQKLDLTAVVKLGSSIRLELEKGGVMIWGEPA